MSHWGLNAERMSTSVRERDTGRHGGVGGAHRDQRVGHPPLPLRVAGGTANSNNRARLGERHRTVVTRALTLNTAARPLLSRPSTSPDSLRSEEKRSLPFYGKSPKVARTGLPRSIRGSLRDSNARLNPRLEAHFTFHREGRTIVSDVFL